MVTGPNKWFDEAMLNRNDLCCRIGILQFIKSDQAKILQTIQDRDMFKPGFIHHFHCMTYRIVEVYGDHGGFKQLAAIGHVLY